MISFFLILILSLLYIPLIHSEALGPPQVCRCFPPGTTPVGVCPSPFATTGPYPGQCQKRIRVDISFVADDGVSLFICGIKVRQSSNFDEMQTFTYEDNCDDFMLEVVNHGLSAGVALLATFNGQKYGTTDASGRFTVPGTKPLFAIAKFQPPGPWFNNPPGFDFSMFTPAVVVESIVDIPPNIAPNFNFLKQQGAFPINVQSGNVAPGIYGLKLMVPFCQ